MKKKKILAFLCLCCVLFSLCVPTIAFAADNEKLEERVNGYKDIIDSIINDQTTLGNDDDAKFYTDIKAKLEEVMNEPETEGTNTIRGGYDIIENVELGLSSEYSNMDELRSLWKKRFREIAEQSGVEMGTTGWLTGESHEKEANELEDASVKVNMLTWNNSASETKNEGVIMEMLKGFDNTTSFTAWIRGIAIALAITFGCMTMLSMTQDRQMTTEALQREFIKLLFGVWLIMNFKFFALLIIRVGTLIVEQVMLLPTDLSGTREHQVINALWQSLAEIAEENPQGTKLQADMATGWANITAGAAASLSNTFGPLTGLIGSGIIQLVSSLVVYAVAAEIGIRYVFTPIAIADLYSERFRSNGWMWLKKLFACSMQGAVIFMIIFVINIIKQSVDTFDPITNTAINLTMIGMFAKSRAVANDIVGVH